MKAEFSSCHRKTSAVESAGPIVLARQAAGDSAARLHLSEEDLIVRSLEKLSVIDVDNIDDYTSIFIFNGQEIMIDDNEENEIEDGRIEEFAGSLSPPLLQHFGTIQTIENKTKVFIVV